MNTILRQALIFSVSATLTFGALEALKVDGSRDPAANRSRQQQLSRDDLRCESRSGYIQCLGSVENYPKRVAFIFPEGSSRIDSVQVHLHGNLVGRGRSFSTLLSSTNFPALMSKSGMSNRLLIIPESDDHCATFNSALPGNFMSFVGRALKAVGGRVQASGRLRVILSGHSRAHEPVARILRSEGGKISAVALFDATYPGFDLQGYANYAKGGKLSVAYQPGQTGAGAEALAKAAPQAKLINARNIGHFEVVDQYFDLAR